MDSNQIRSLKASFFIVILSLLTGGCPGGGEPPRDAGPEDSERADGLTPDVGRDSAPTTDTGAGPCDGGTCSTIPTLVAALPSHVLGAQPTEVRIRGTNLRAGLRVRMDGIDATVVSRLSSEEIVVQTPALGLTRRPVRVELTNEDGTGVVNSSILFVREVLTQVGEIRVISTTGGQAHYLEVADLDGDGRPEVIAPLVNLGTLQIFRQNVDDGTYASAARIPVSPGPFFPVVADFNGDSLLDIAVSFRDQPAVGVLRNSGLLSFGYSQTVVNTACAGLAVGNLVGGDRLPDLVVGGNSTTNGLRVLRGQEDGTLAASHTLYTGGPTPYPVIGEARFSDPGSDSSITQTVIFGVMRPVSPGASGSLVTAFDLSTAAPRVRFTPVDGIGGTAVFAQGDLNQTGPLDFLFTTATGGLALFSTGIAVDSSMPTSPVGVASRTGSYVDPSLTGGAASVAIADFNGDQANDLIVVGPSGGIRIYPNLGGGRFGSEIFISLPLGAPSSAIVRDMNGDGKPDLVIALPTSERIQVIHNTSVISD